jgi:hypothetical protein
VRIDLAKRLRILQYLIIGMLTTIASAEVTAVVDTTDKDKGIMDLRELLPDESLGWTAQSEIAFYDRESIFDYMNGAGEVYRMYAYREMVVQRMAEEGQPEITIELFDMSTPEDAYGIFSHSRLSEDSSPGQGATYQSGLLCFWKSRYFVCITAMRETPETKKALYDIAGKIDRFIPNAGSKPAILECLPQDSLDRMSVRYFHLYTSLNYHYYLADQNILKLNEKTEAVIAQYEPYRSFLVCIRYPNGKLSEEAMSSFREAYTPETDSSGLAQIEDGKWVAAELVSTFILLALDAPTPDYAINLIKATKKRLADIDDRER